MYPPFIFVKEFLNYWRHGVDVNDDVTATNALRRVNEKMF